MKKDRNRKNALTTVSCFSHFLKCSMVKVHNGLVKSYFTFIRE